MGTGITGLMELKTSPHNPISIARDSIMIVQPEPSSLIGVPPSTKITLNTVGENGQNVVVVVMETYEDVISLINRGHFQDSQHT